MNNKTSRISKYYEKRAECLDKLKYSFFDIGNLYIIQSRERRFLNILKGICSIDLSSKLVLDVGCGSGNFLRSMIQYGFSPKKMSGIDLFPERIKKAKEMSGGINFRQGNAERLPYKTGSFDLVTQYTVFTSVLEPGIKKNIAREMIRVVKKDGYIIWYDMRITNPTDKNIRAIGKKEIRELFKGCEIKFYPVTLNPFISRRLARVSVILCNLLEKIGVLNSHYFAVIKKST